MQFPFAWRGSWGEGGRGQQRDRPDPLFAQQRSIAQGQFAWRNRAQTGRRHHLAANQTLREIGPHGFLAQSALLQRLGESGIAEVAVGTLEGRNLGDFAIDQARAGDDADLPAEFGQRRPAEHILQHPVEPAAGDEAFHRHARVLLLDVFHRGARRLAKLRRGYPLLADRRHPISAAAGCAAGVGDVAGRKGEAKQDDETDGDGDADAGTHEFAKEPDHLLFVWGGRRHLR